MKEELIITTTTTGIFFALKEANEGISGCHGYHETCQWNLWRGSDERLRILQKIDQGMIQHKFYRL